MDLFEAIAQRHSYRGSYLNTPVPREHLRRIVQAGLQAPSGCNNQTTTFVIVDEPELLRAIGGMPKATVSLQQAKALIACVVPNRLAHRQEFMTFEIEDCAAAVENILLAIAALGYASVWLDGWLRVGGRAHQIAEWLGVPGDRSVRVLLPVGVPAEPAAPPEKLPFEARAWFNRYREM